MRRRLALSVDVPCPVMDCEEVIRASVSGEDVDVEAGCPQHQALVDADLALSRLFMDMAWDAAAERDRDLYDAEMDRRIDQERGK